MQSFGARNHTLTRELCWHGKGMLVSFLLRMQSRLFILRILRPRPNPNRVPRYDDDVPQQRSTHDPTIPRRSGAAALLSRIVEEEAVKSAEIEQDGECEEGEEEGAQVGHSKGVSKETRAGSILCHEKAPLVMLPPSPAFP
jgi:hypothetical protein